jgi:hypothetical protein
MSTRLVTQCELELGTKLAPSMLITDCACKSIGQSLEQYTGLTSFCWLLSSTNCMHICNHSAKQEA